MAIGLQQCGFYSCKMDDDVYTSKQWRVGIRGLSIVYKSHRSNNHLYYLWNIIVYTIVKCIYREYHTHSHRSLKILFCGTKGFAILFNGRFDVLHLYAHEPMWEIRR